MAPLLFPKLRRRRTRRKMGKRTGGDIQETERKSREHAGMTGKKNGALSAPLN